MKKKLIGYVGVAGMGLTLLVGCGGGGEPKAELVNARLEPWTNAQGQAAQMVYIDWKNSGNGPARTVHADINLYDAAGNKLAVSAPDYTIYVVGESADGIAAGQSYSEPAGEGYAVPSSTPATKVDVRITRTSSKGFSY